jgi:glycosyltransferase involved in cell wall biosynthesis
VNQNSPYLAVVPAYNEAATVGRVVGEIQEHAPQFDVLVVDDGSTDGSGEVAEAAGARVLRHPFNLGIGGAVQSGFVYAFDNRYRYMVQVDADGQHLPEELSKLLEAMKEDPSLDMVCGSRFLIENGYPAPISRRAGIHIFAFLLSRIMGRRVSDPTSGFRLYNRRGIALFARDYPHDYPEVEAVLMVHFHRLKVQEVPVRMLARGGGTSSIRGSGKSVYYMIKVLLAIFVGLVRARPVVEPGDEAPVAAGRNI